MSKLPSLRDVAKLADVSLGTASRALNNKNNVLPETRARVLKAASELGYKQQFRVPTTISKKINTIGVAVKRDIGDNNKIDPFNYEILTGIEAECQSLGLSLMFSSIQVDKYSHATSVPPIVEDDAVDGLIIVGANLDSPEITQKIPDTIPVVLVDGYDANNAYDSVHIDNFDASYNAVTYLIEQGHTQIGLIGSEGGQHEHPGVRVRYFGYLRALESQGIEKVNAKASGLLSEEAAYPVALKMLQESPELTAIFCCNDQIAHGTILAASELGLNVPGDLSIMGFDDTNVAQITTPKLTTVFVDKSLMGALGVRHLVERAADLERVSVNTRIRTQLVIRDSVSQLVDKQLSNGRHA